MRKFLEDMYYSNSNLCEREIDKKSNYYKALLEQNKIYDILYANLSEQQKTLLEEYIHLACATQSEAELDNFILGIRFGVNLMCECLIDSDD